LAPVAVSGYGRRFLAPEIYRVARVSVDRVDTEPGQEYFMLLSVSLFILEPTSRRPHCDIIIIIYPVRTTDAACSDRSTELLYFKMAVLFEPLPSPWRCRSRLCWCRSGPGVRDEWTRQLLTYHSHIARSGTSESVGIVSRLVILISSYCPMCCPRRRHSRQSANNLRF
jgi:hypothetical protein